MLLFIAVLLFELVGAQFCQPAKPPLHLPVCTDSCISGDDKFYDGNCADNLAGFCTLSDGVRAYMNIYGPCIRDACVNKVDREMFIAAFRAACASTSVAFSDSHGFGDFTSDDLINGTPSSGTSTATSTALSMSEVETASTTTGGNGPQDTTTESATSETSTAGSSTPSSSQTPGPPQSSQEPSRSNVAPPQSTQGPPTSSDAPTPIVTTERSTTVINGATSTLVVTHLVTPNDASAHSHTTFATTTKLASSPTPSAAPAAPAMSIPALAGTVAGGTAGLALVISLIYILMRRRKRRQSRASSANIWEPSCNTHNDRPTLPIISKLELDSNATFGRYFERSTAAPMRQLSNPQLHRETIPPPHPHSTPPPRDPFKTPGEQARYYHPSQRPEQQHRQASNIDSRYPSLVPTSPTSPVSETSTMQNWAPSGVPAPGNKLSYPDLRGEGVRSPAFSELGGNGSVRKVRSAELHGADMMSPVSELGSDGGFMRGNGVEAAELGRDVPKDVVDMEGSTIHKPNRGGVATNF